MLRILHFGGDQTVKKAEKSRKTHPDPEDLLELRIDPEQRLCLAVDSTCIDLYRVASEKMGVRVVDNCCEDNIK